MHDPSVSSKSIPISSSTLSDEDHDAVLEKVVDCAFMEPSPFLSEGVNSSEEEPLVLLVDDLSIACIHNPPSFTRSLEDIYLLEFDGADQGKKRSQFMKRRRTQVESTYAKDRSLCSRRMLKKDG